MQLYCIITTADEIEEYQYKHKFQTGLNICPHSRGFCIYNVSAIPKRLPIHANDTYIRFVTFLPDSNIRSADNNTLFPDNCQLYAYQIIASDRIKLSDYITEDMIKEADICLNWIPKERRTYSMYLSAIRGCYEWIKYIPEQTAEACLAAVAQDCRALLHIKKLTPELCLIGLETAKKHPYYCHELLCPWLTTLKGRSEVATLIPQI